MYRYIQDDSNFYDLAFALSDNRVTEVYCDVETNGLDVYTSKLLLFQIMCGEEIFIFDFVKLNQEHLIYLMNLLIKSDVTCVFHNTKFDLKFLRHFSGIWLSKVFDTMNCEVLLNAGIGKSTYKLSELALKYCGVDLEKDSRELFTTHTDEPFSEQALTYAANDVYVLREIHRQQIEQIKFAREEKVLELEMNLIPVVAKMEYDGVLLDKIRWSELAEKESIRLAKVSEYIISTILGGIDVSKYTDAYQLATALSIPVHTKKLERELTLISIPELMLNWAKENFNIASPKQLKTALDLMGIKTASTDKKVLKKLSKSEIVDALLEKSECAKRISTYGMGVLDFISTVSGRIHTEFLNMGTATGRFSSGNPINLQNIPVAPGYRESFIAQPDFEWISADYSQEEFRLTGAIANEPKIIEAYNSGADMHTATAAIIYNKTLSEVTKEERFVGKTANFAIIYGGTEYTLGKNLNISQEKSEEMLRSFKKGFPILSAFKDKAEEFIVKHGYSTTLLGRKRHSPQKPLYMNSREYMTFIQKIKREGFNHIIQGSAADIIKIAMVNIYTKNPFGDKFRMLIQVHDEINAEAHKSVSKDAAQFLKEEMLKAEQPFLKDIPAQVDVNISDHWIH